MDGKKKVSKARWAILRRALLRVARGGKDGATDAASVRRHAGFGLLPQREVAGRALRLAVRISSRRSGQAGWLARTGRAGSWDELQLWAHGRDVQLLTDVCDKLRGWSAVCWPPLRLTTALRGGVVEMTVLLSRHPALAEASAEGKEAADDEEAEAAPARQLDRRDWLLPGLQRQLLMFTWPPAAMKLEHLVSHREEGVDNTGNVCVWPSEEVLAHLLLRRADELAGKRLLELGAGMSGLAGQAAAAAMADKRAGGAVVITDGNLRAVRCLRTALQLNADAGAFAGVRASACKLLWSRDADADELAAELGGRFHCIAAADCLFFKDFHIDLLHVLRSLLLPGCSALLLAPRRGKTLELFMTRAREEAGACCELSESYDDAVSAAHAAALSREEYDADIHYPLLLRVWWE